MRVKGLQVEGLGLWVWGLEFRGWGVGSARARARGAKESCSGTQRTCLPNDACQYYEIIFR